MLRKIVFILANFTQPILYPLKNDHFWPKNHLFKPKSGMGKILLFSKNCTVVVVSILVYFLATKKMQLGRLAIMTFR